MLLYNVFYVTFVPEHASFTASPCSANTACAMFIMGHWSVSSYKGWTQERLIGKQDGRTGGGVFIVLNTKFRGEMKSN